MPNSRSGAIDALKSEMSPLQQRLLATYMDALEEQEDDEPATEVAAPVEPVVAPEPPDPEEQRIQAAKSRSDMYAKKMSELLLKGWKMLGENCPETGDVPLMMHPTSGRKFSIATGRYTDEAPPAVVSPAKPPTPAQPSPPKAASPRPKVAFPTVGNAAPRVEPVAAAPIAPASRDDDDSCAVMSSLMLKGWKMLNESCPITGLVPLMEHPTNGRKYSTAARRFIDEEPTPAAAVVSAAPAPAVGGDDDDDDEEEDADEWAEVEAAPGRLPRATMPPPPPPSRLVSSGHSSESGVSPPIPRRAAGGGARVPPAAAAGADYDDVSAQSLAAIDEAEAAVAAQLAATTALLARAPTPPPRALLETIARCAETIEGLAKARKACM